MTISATTNKVRTQGNGSVTDFNFTFKVFTAGDLKVYLVDADGVATLKTITTHYTVALNSGGVGGVVTMLTAPASTEEVLIVRVIALTQTTDIPAVGRLGQEQTEDVYDKLVMQIQQLQEQIDRAVVQSVAATASFELPDAVADKVLGWNSAGTALENKTLEVTETQYAGVIAKGADADKDATPSAGDIYLATDTGRLYICYAGGIWSLVKRANALLLDEGSAPTVAAGQLGLYVKDTAGQPELFYRKESDGTEVQLTSNGALNVSTYTPTAANALSGSVIQVVNTQTGAYSSGSTAIPSDDTIPQNTEGDEYMTLAITPTNASNKLKIDVVATLSNGTQAHVRACLFQDSTADALRVGSTSNVNTNNIETVSFTHFMAAGTTSPITFKVRCGSSSGTTYFNGASGARAFGGVLASSITITEIKA